VDLDISPVVERTIHGARFSLRLGASFDRRYREPLTFMTQRRRLDEFLAERAAESGADFHDGEAIREIDLSVSQTPGGSAPSVAPITIRTDTDTYASRTLIGADGANGLCGKSLGLRRHYEEAVALEGNAEFSPDIPADWHEYVALDIGGLAGGYGWVFPKGDHLNVGVGAWKYAGFTLRPKLGELCRRYGFDADALTNLRGYHLPVRVPGSPIARGPVAVAGDAAGLVDPLTGEGIHMAFASGRLAAEQALRVLAGEAPDMTGYQRRLDRTLQPELTVSRKLQELLNFAPPPYVTMMQRSRKFWLFFCHIIRGEMTYLDFIRMIGPMRVAVDYLAGAAERRRLSRVRALSPLLRSRT
jgi:flavin-dependent dehydrogenase